MKKSEGGRTQEMHVHLNIDIVKRLKVKAILEDKTLQQVCEEIFTKALEK